MPILGLAEFEQIGGKPSGGFWSHYSDIYKLIDEIGENYDSVGFVQNLPVQKMIIKLENKVRYYYAVDREAEGKKKQELDAVLALKAGINQQMDMIKVHMLLAEMAADKMALQRNTGRNLLGKLKNGAISLAFNAAADENARYTAGTLRINKTSFWRDPQFAKAVLVHEYHHVLTKRNPNIYIDEFVAHWKQYTVEGYVMDVARVTELNNFLLRKNRNGVGYNLIAAGQYNGPEFTRPEDAGDVWNSYYDNVMG